MNREDDSEVTGFAIMSSGGTLIILGFFFVIIALTPAVIHNESLPHGMPFHLLIIGGLFSLIMFWGLVLMLFAAIGIPTTLIIHNSKYKKQILALELVLCCLVVFIFYGPNLFVV